MTTIAVESFQEFLFNIKEFQFPRDFNDGHGAEWNTYAQLWSGYVITAKDFGNFKSII